MLRDDDFNGTKVKVVKIELLDYPTFQRGAMAAWAKKIADNWDHHLFTFPRVWQKPDGRFDVIDGQHEVLAAEMRGHDQLPCTVLVDIDHAKAAAIFSDINTQRKRLTPLDVYCADLEAGRKWALDLEELAARHGIHIGKGSNAFTLQAVGQARSIIEEGRLADLDDAVAVLTGAYDPTLEENASRLERKLIVGAVDMIARSKRAGMFDRDLFIKKLQRAVFKRRDIRGIRLTPESLETTYIPALIEQGTIEMPPLNSAMGNAVLFGRALAIAIFGAERARTLYS